LRKEFRRSDGRRSGLRRKRERVADPTTPPAPVPPVNVTVVNPPRRGIFGRLSSGGAT